MAFPFRRASPSVIRSLRVDRAGECAEVHAAAFAHSWTAEEIESLLTSASTFGSAALDPSTNRLRGFALSRLAADEAEILTIAVDPGWRRRGVGRDLMREHLQRATLAGARALFLEVDADNTAAITLYHRFNFVKVGERAGYYRRADGKAATALVMLRTLA